MAEAVALHVSGDLPAAARLYGRILAATPDHVDALQLLGAVALMRGEASVAAALIGRAIRLSPVEAVFHSNYGNASGSLGQSDVAILSYRRALALNPAHIDAWSNYGSLLSTLGKSRQAKTACRRALRLKPGFPQAEVNLGNALFDLGDVAAASHCYDRVLRRAPDHHGALAGKGAVLVAAGQIAGALAFIRGTLCSAPDHALAWNNLGTLLSRAGQTEEAQTYLGRAIEIEPANAENHSNLLFSMLHQSSLSGEVCYLAHRVFSQRHEKPLRARWPIHGNSRNEARKLRVGLVSADFRDHPVAKLILPVVQRLGLSDGVELVAYYNHPIADSVTEKLRLCMSDWVSTVDLGDDELAALIQAHGMDILVDLSGHTAGNRLPVFARKPAPIQVSWLGYPATTGLDAVDYYLADPVMAPPGAERFFSEKIVRLPAVCCFETDGPACNALPALENGYVTFGSFNRASKLSDPVIDLWCKALDAVPDSRMLIGNVDDASLAKKLIGCFSAGGITADRLEFQGRVGMWEFQRLHNRVDLVFDTFPYGGGTTSAHAVWMGVPVITLAGDRMSSRQTASMLFPLGLDEFVAESEAEFVDIAARWSSDLGRLDEIRGGLREKISQMPSADATSVAGAVEGAFRHMWRLWCAGWGPESFEIAG